MDPDLQEANCSVIQHKEGASDQWVNFKGLIFGAESTSLPESWLENPSVIEVGDEVAILNPAKGAGWGQINDLLRAEFIQFVGSVAGHNVLDIGGGRGFVASELYERSKEQQPRLMYQTDSNPDVLAFADKLTAQHPGFQAIKHSLGTTLPFEDQMFDTVIAKSVFLLLPEDVIDHTLEELSRVSNRDTAIFISFVHPEWLWDIDIKEDYPDFSDHLKHQAFDRGLKLQRYGDGKPIYRPLEWYRQKFAEHGLQISAEREVLMPSAERVEMFPRFGENEGHKFYYMCKLTTD